MGNETRTYIIKHLLSCPEFLPANPWRLLQPNVAVLNTSLHNVVEAIKMKTKSTSRFTLDMTLALRTRLKIAAARRNITMREYCLSAIEQQLAQEELGVITSGNFDSKAIGEARVLQELIFGHSRLPDDSAELIRQIREQRVGQL